MGKIYYNNSYDNNNNNNSNSDEDEDDHTSFSPEESKDIYKLFDRVDDIVDSLRYYAWSHGLNMLTSNKSKNDLLDLIEFNQN